MHNIAETINEIEGTTNNIKRNAALIVHKNRVAAEQDPAMHSFSILRFILPRLQIFVVLPRIAR